MNKQLSIILFILFTGILIIKPSYAQTPTCTPVFGGGSSCSLHPDLSITKEIQEPGSSAFRDSLTTQNKYFKPSSNITFRIIVKNISGNTLPNIQISDSLPPYLTDFTGNGKFDMAARTFSDTITKLDKGQSKTYTIKASILSDAQLPDQPKPLCLINQATVTQNNKAGADSATFCITKVAVKTQDSQSSIQTPNQTKGGLPIYTQTKPNATPSTGPEAFTLVSILFSSFGGIYLRRKTLKSSNK